MRLHNNNTSVFLLFMFYVMWSNIMYYIYIQFPFCVKKCLQCQYCCFFPFKFKFKSEHIKYSLSFSSLNSLKSTELLKVNFKWSTCCIKCQDFWRSKLIKNWIKSCVYLCVLDIHKFQGQGLVDVSAILTHTDRSHESW